MSAPDTLARFQPDVGPAITRPRFGARLEVWSFGLMMETRPDLDAWESWFWAGTAAGALPFVWRHPTRRNVTIWKFEGGESAYSLSFESTDATRLSFAAMLLPGVPWFGPYVPEGTVRLPAFVADYAGEVFGIGAETVPASALPGIAGTFDLWTTDDQGGTTVEPAQAVTAGDIPATAPTGVHRIVGFAP